MNVFKPLTWKKKESQLTTFCLEFGFWRSHSMSREPDDGNWWWHGKVALSPTTFFISVWAPTDSRLNRTEERGKEMSDADTRSIQTWDKEADAADGKQSHADGGNCDARRTWPRIPINIWQMLRHITPRCWRERILLFFTGNWVYHRRSEGSIMMIFL